MRAIYFPINKFEINQSIVVGDRKHHHLCNVVRIQSNDEILLLNGEGVSAKAKVKEIAKKNTKLEILAVCERKRPKKSPDVAFCMTKKDAFERALANSCEMGVKNFYPVYSKFSQRNKLNRERVERVLSSALEQSNNPYLPIVHEPIEIFELPYSNYSDVILLSSETSEDEASTEEYKKAEKRLLLVGPEGGFEEKELFWLKGIKNCHFVRFELPIMRAENALLFGAGHLYL